MRVLMPLRRLLLIVLLVLLGLLWRLRLLMFLLPRQVLQRMLLPLLLLLVPLQLMQQAAVGNITIPSRAWVGGGDCCCLYVC